MSKVLVLDTNYGYNVDNEFDQKFDAVTSNGSSIYKGTLTADVLKGVEVVSLSFANRQLTDGEIAVLKSYIGNGGRLALWGDGPGFATNNNYLNDALSKLGIDIKLTNVEGRYDGSATKYAATADEFNAGITSVGSVNYSSTLTVINDAHTILKDGAGNAVGAYDRVGLGEVFVFGDTNIRNVDNKAFFDRLANFEFVPVNGAPVVLHSSLVTAMGACDMGATIGANDLKSMDPEGKALGYTVTSASAGTLLIDGEIASVGSKFTQADIDAGHVQLLAGPLTPATALATPNGAIAGTGIVFGDKFNFSVSDGVNVVDGTFKAGHTAFDTAQTSAQYGGYWGGNGNDYQLGTANADNMTGGNGCDLMVGGDGNDQMHGGEGNNHLFGQVGNDILTGGSGDDLLDGGSGDDQLHANGGNNILIGGAGNDMMTADNGNDRMFGGGGDDNIQANGGNNRVDAGAGNDIINVGNGNDVVIGGTGTDRISDNGGSNKFQLGGIAGAVSDGNDSYTTGQGADKYALLLTDRAGNAAGWGKDVINGFRIAEGDQLVAFNGKAGFWDDKAELGKLIDQGFVSGSRSADGGDLTLKFGTGAEASSVTLKWFFWDNASFLSDAEKGSTFGQNIAKANLIGILEDAIQDGGSVGVGGSDFVNAAHNYVSHDFML